MPDVPGPRLSTVSIARRRLAGLLLLFVQAAGMNACAGIPGLRPAGGPDAGLPGAPAASAEGRLPLIAADLLSAANRARAREALPPLHPDAALDRAAQQYARELAQRGVLSHTSPTPGLETMTRRIEAAGGTWTHAAENLARLGGPGSEAGRHIVDLWMTSAPHRANVMSRTYTHAGSGVARGARGEWVAVQLYVRPARAGRE
jgi:uncharacterized protein YkwD